MHRLNDPRDDSILVMVGGQKTMRQIATAQFRSLTSISHRLNELTEIGLVTPPPTPQQRYSLTEKGKAYLDACGLKIPEVFSYDKSCKQTQEKLDGHRMVR